MAQAFVNTGDVLLVTADAVQCLGNEDVKSIFPGLIQKRQHAWAVAQVTTANGVIGKDLNHGHAVVHRAFSTQADLIIDGRFRLQV